MNLKTLLSVIIILANCSLVQAAGDYEEVSYDSLLNELSRKKIKLTPKPDPFENIMIHSGLGFVNSVSNLHVSGQDITHFHSGIQLSVGIDLFSNHWYSEGSFRNFGQSDTETETHSLREFDLKVMYKNELNRVWGMRAGGGIAARYYKYNDTSSGISISDTTPTSLFTLGLDTHINKNFAFGIEWGLRSAMVNRTIDKNSADMSVRFDAFF